MPPPPSPTAAPCRPARFRLRAVAGQAPPVLLGLFVLFQLVFLLAGNLATLAEQVAPLVGRAPPSPGTTREVMLGWADLTGQHQDWSLFAPDTNDVIPFVGVEFRWEDGRPPHFLPSDNEPADPCHFFRAGRFRLRRFESTIDVTPLLRDGDFDAAGPQWRATLDAAVWERWPSMLAYLRWRLADFGRSRPDLPPPAEVILEVHVYRIPPPPGPRPWRWQDLGWHPVARWRPGVNPAPGPFALEVFDPVRGEFRDRRKGEP